MNVLIDENVNDYENVHVFVLGKKKNKETLNKYDNEIIRLCFRFFSTKRVVSISNFAAAVVKDDDDADDVIVGVESTIITQR